MTIDWPPGWDRTPSGDRTRGPYQVDWRQAESELVHEIELAGGVNIDIDRELGSSRAVQDPGVVVRWIQDGDGKVMACDAHTGKDANLRAIGLTIRDLRKATTRGVIQEDRAFQGLDALPPTVGSHDGAAPRAGSQAPHDVLGVSPDADDDVVQLVAKRLKARYHPDSGEDPNEGAFMAICDAEEAMLDG